jgi:hypothetical protein
MTTLNRFAPATRDNPAGFHTREITITREASGEGETLRIAFSSEAEVERYDWRTGETYLEVLDHSPGSVDLSYARDGLPFCVDHDLRRVVGIGEQVTIDPDRMGRCTVRQGHHPDAAWVFPDMRDGIRPKASFGYWPGDNYVQEKRADGMLVRRYIGWAPYEVSSVPVPADYEVGVGRSAPGATASQVPPAAGAEPHTKESSMSAVATPEPGTAPASDTRTAERLAVLERDLARKSAMLQLGEAAGLSLAETYAFINDPEKTPDHMGRELLTKAAEKLREQPKALVLTPKEQKAYSFMRLITGLANDERSGFEFEVSDEIAKRMGKPGKGSVYYPTTGDAPFEVATGKRTQLGFAAGAGKGGELKFTEYNGFFDALRARMVLGRTQAQFVQGLQGDFAITVQTGPGSFVWGAEPANAALSSLTIAQRLGQPRVGQSATSFTRQFMRQSAEAVEPLVRRDLLAIHGRGVETAAYAGSGAANNPRGVLNTVGVNLVALGTNGGAPTYNMAVDMETEVAADNADADAMAFITTTRVRGTLRKTQEFAGTNGSPVWTGGRDGELLGYPAYATNLVPGNLVKGTSGPNCHSAIFGDWSSLYVLEWGAAELMVDPITNGPGIIRVLSYQLIDILVRFPESFTIVNDILP